MRGSTIVVAAIALTLAACAYRGGSFSHSWASFEGKRVTVGCIDAAVAPWQDATARGPVAAFSLGNRCDAAVTVDLVRPAMLRFADGTWAMVRARDPEVEIRPRRLDARFAGREFVEFERPLHRGEPTELCLDLSHLDVEAPSPRPLVVCIPASGEVAS